MIDIIEDIAQYKVDKNYQLDKPLGVRGRSSDNSYVTEKIGWKPKNSLKKVSQKLISGSNNRLIVEQILISFVKVILKNNLI